MIKKLMLASVCVAGFSAVFSVDAVADVTDCNTSGYVALTNTTAGCGTSKVQVCHGYKYGDLVSNPNAFYNGKCCCHN